MKVDELREKYLSFFETKAHKRYDSDVLVPTWDPSVLFTPAGMNQFKPHFLGKIKLEHTRTTTCQKCLRTGDIDNVGRTAYHHTFFEMLGNFSFGDYFKKDAIQWAWEFLTQKQWLGIDADRLSATVYKDDDEAAEIWATEIGLPTSRIERMDEEDNFWPASAPSQGPDGVCGPCSEIFYHDDHGGSVEIWNLVFTQFNRVGNPPDNLRSLPSKNIDTGMGLERTAAVLQGVDTNFHIDNLLPIVKAAADICSVNYEPGSETGRRLRRITDHVRACTFSIHENVYPGPNKEKYVIRRLLRRAVLDGHQIGMREPFLHHLVTEVADVMKQAYPELSETTGRVASVIEQEEAAFFGTIDDGLQRINSVFKDMQTTDSRIVDGAKAAAIYQTHGVPAELFESVAIERGFTFDWDGYQTAMKKHGENPGKPAHDVMSATGPIDALKKSLKETIFLGYQMTESPAEVKGIIADDQLHESYSADGPLIVVLDQTPFYGESGGQVGDSGKIEGDGCVLEVKDTKKDGDLFLHHCEVESGTVRIGSQVKARVNTSRRQGIRRAHSATHILHHALQQNLGSHAQQQGSKVEDDMLRFDFTHMTAVTQEELDQIEKQVTEKVKQSEEIKAEVLPLSEARSAGAMMLFGEKYPDPVRMVSMGSFSKELCGGTHLDRTGDVQAFEFLAEEGVSAGTRRVTALTGQRAIEHSQSCKTGLESSAQQLECGLDQVSAATRQITKQVRDLKKQLAGHGKAQPPSKTFGNSDVNFTPHQIKSVLRNTARILNVGLSEVPNRIAALIKERASLLEQIAARGDQKEKSAEDLIGSAEVISDVKIIVADLPMANPNSMRRLIDQIRKMDGSSAVLLAGSSDAKVTLVAGITRDLVDKGVSAGNWVKEVAPVVGGGGGGKADMAQAGGKNPGQIPAALEKAKSVIKCQLDQFCG